MPELPDVENYRRELEEKALHRRMVAVEVLNRKSLAGMSAQTLDDALRGRTLEVTERRGKHLLVRLDRGGWVAFHFGMTGRFQPYGRNEDPPPHIRVRFDFEDGSHLAFVDMRLLGRIALVADPHRHAEEHELGPDALDVSEAEFDKRLGSKTGQLKPALMDQSVIAGIGNIFADEILFQARLHPKTSVGALKKADFHSIYRTMREVLETAISRGAGAEGYQSRLPDNYLLRGRDAGAPCPACGGTVETLKVGGRTTYCCPNCQKPR